MGQENEASFPVEKFSGVDRNLDREDVSPGGFYALQNLWERTVGVLETRGGSEQVNQTLPSGIIGLNGINRIYRSKTESHRILGVQCQTDVLYNWTMPGNISMSYETSSGGGNFFNTYAVNFSTSIKRIILRFVGWGLDKEAALISSSQILNHGTPNSRLVIDIANSLTSGAYEIPNLTGIEVIAEVEVGASGSSAPGRLWLGHIPIDSIGSYIGQHSFKYSPFGTAVVPVVQSGQTARTFNAQSIYDPNGTLTPGKTYYVLWAAEHLLSGQFTYNQQLCYIAPNIPITGVLAVVIQEGHNAIYVNNFSISTISACMFIGEHRQLLQPAGVTDGNSGTITSLPSGQPGLMDITVNAANDYTYSYRYSDFSVKDMFAKIDDSGNLTPVFASRLNYYSNKDILLNEITGTLNFANQIQLDPSYIENWQQLGDGDLIDSEQFQGNLLIVNTRSPKKFEEEYPTPQIFSRHASGTNYYICGSAIAGACIEENYAASLIRLPSFTKIFKFDEAIILTGGSVESDIYTGLSSDSSRTVYFSRVLNPFDFTIAGAGSPAYQFFTVDTGGEEISGLGLFSFTSGDLGPQGQLLVGKRTSLWMLPSLPTVDSGNLEQVFLSNLTKGAGCAAHRAMVNTPIGLILAAFDNVYLMRDSGEPTPLGDPIRNILRGADLSRAIAVYHDSQYKLSFYHPDYPGTAGYNNVEFWLDVNKVKLMQGTPDWKGPMVGRQIDAQIVEDLEGDGLSYDDSRDRFCIDKENLVVFKADVFPGANDTQVLDFAIPVTSILESKDFEIGPEDNNWNKVLKRTYWKARVANTIGSPLSANESTYADGVIVDTKTIEFIGQFLVPFDSQPLLLNRVFPKGRPRGRTFRKVLSTDQRIGIGGFAINFQIERRRI